MHAVHILGIYKTMFILITTTYFYYYYSISYSYSRYEFYGSSNQSFPFRLENVMKTAKTVKKFAS